MSVLANLAAMAAKLKLGATARVEGAKVFAMGKTSAVKDCALARVEAVKTKATTVFLHQSEATKMWWGMKRKECKFRAHMRKTDKEIYNLEHKVKVNDYRVNSWEYQQWRKEQVEIASRDIWKRMQRLGKIDPGLEYPQPLSRPDLYDKRPCPLRPKKPLAKSYAEYLKSSDELGSLLDKTLYVFLVRPIATVTFTVVSVAVLFEIHEESKIPGSLRKRLSVMAKVLQKAKNTIDEIIPDDGSRVDQDEATKVDQDGPKV